MNDVRSIKPAEDSLSNEHSQTAWFRGGYDMPVTSAASLLTLLDDRRIR